MLKKTLFIFNLIFLLLLSGCLEEEEKAPAPATVRTPTLDFSLLTPSCFSAYSGNPILQTNDLFTNAMWNDPSVIYENGQYIMYASASVGFDGDYLKMWFAGHQSFTLGIGYASCYLKN